MKPPPPKRPPPPPTKPPPDRDLGKLHPAFRERVELLLRAMRARGFDPIVWETFRTRERVAYLIASGKRAVYDSMHCYGLAVDVVSDAKLWSPGPAFWQALGQEARALGLVHGGDFKNAKGEPNPDNPHVQAVDVDDQSYVRRATPEQVTAFVQQRLDANDPSRRKTVRDDDVTGKVQVPGPPKPPSVFPRGGRRA